MKTYFNIPSLFTNAQLGNHSLELLELSVNGSNTLPTVYYTENLPSLKVALTDWDFANCNADSTVCAVGVNNSFNPFEQEFGLTFALVGGFARGTATGTSTGSNYGSAIETLGVDYITVKDRLGAALEGSFYIDIDYTMDFKMVIVHFDGTTSTKYTIEHRAGTCMQYFTSVSNGTTTDLLNYGFLSGDQAGTDYIVVDNCTLAPTYNNGVRTIGFMNRSVLPQASEPNKGFKGCCYENIALADTADDAIYKNDWTGMHYYRKTPNELCTFQLIYGATVVNLIDDTYGTFQDFTDDIKTMIVDWRKVLIALGVNNYILRKNITILGTVYTQDSNTFNLKNYSVENADNTIRLESIMDGFLGSEKYSNYNTSLRVRGYFGSRNPKYTDDNVVYDDYEKEQVSVEQVNEYILQAQNLPECVYGEILDFHFMATKKFISDYNRNNSSYLIKSLPVSMSGGNGVETDPSTRAIDMEYNFTDFFVIKKFN